MEIVFFLIAFGIVCYATHRNTKAWWWVVFVPVFMVLLVSVGIVAWFFFGQQYRNPAALLQGMYHLPALISALMAWRITNVLLAR